jgi:hypothetical protein
MIEADASELEPAVARLRWEEGPVPTEPDWPWLLPWLQSPKGRGSYVRIDEPVDRASLVARVLEMVRLAGSSRGGA